jgi:uncharacterized repeat protein (TIGR04076 family)
MADDILKKYGDRVGFSPSDLDQITEGDPRGRHIERISEVAARYSIVAEVIKSRHCNSGHNVGDRFVLDVDGNFVNKLCPKRMCVYAISQLMVPVAVINERLSEGLDPNKFHFMHQVKCPDVGIDCSGYGEIMMEVKVVPRDTL